MSDALQKYIPEIVQYPMTMQSAPMAAVEVMGQTPQGTLYRIPGDPYPRIRTGRGDFCIVPSHAFNRFAGPPNPTLSELVQEVRRLGMVVAGNIPDGAGTVLPPDVLTQRAQARSGASPFAPGGFIVATGALATSGTQGAIVATIEFTDADLEKLRGATVCDATFTFQSSDPLAVPWNSLGASFLLYGDAVPEMKGFPLLKATTVAQAGGTANAVINRYIPPGSTPRIVITALAAYTGSPEGAKVNVVLSAGQDCATGLGTCTRGGCGCGG